MSQEIAVIGAGRVALSLVSALQNAGHIVRALGARDRQKARDVLELAFPGAECRSAAIDVMEPSEACLGSDLVFLAVSDQAILPLSRELAESKSFKDGALVCHLSGALGSACLDNLKETSSCLIASAHPLNTFAGKRPVNLAGTYWFCEGDKEAMGILFPLILSTGGIPQLIKAEKKPLYHASSVVASNYLTALIAAALELLGASGTEGKAALEALEPLLRSALENTLSLGPQEALSGPVSRGDTETIEVHLKALGEMEPVLGKIYKTMGLYALKLAAQRSVLKEDKLSRIRAQFEEPSIN